MAKFTNKLHFISTWWTIDSYYEVTKDTAVPYEHTVIPKFIEILKLYEECEFTEVCMKDSRSIIESDRESLLAAVVASTSKRIIITHGTYTLPDTARYLQARMKTNNKVIMFVCSMIPLEGFMPSDAWFNLWYAVAKSQDLQEGMYVCMNGRIFDPQEVVKIISEGRFWSIYTR